jgi:hypothetical protein
MNDRRLSVKLAPTFADGGFSVDIAWNPTAVFSVLETEAANFSSKLLLNCSHQAEWTPFQTHYFSENLVEQGIEPGPLYL